ncbi:MAG: M16 family metallopeptidase [Geminicoccales bacterium]
MIINALGRIGASIGLVACLLVSGQQTEAAVFNPETFTLANGMQVVVITNRRAPVVTHHVWYRIGSADSPLGKSGLPHFHEHLMFKATETLDSGEFSKEVARNGGNDNAFTGQDYTGYFQTIAKDRLELVMRMEADRMTNLILGEDEVLRERDVVLEERSMRVDNDPSSRFAEQMNAAQFLHHPYRMPVIGWRHEIEDYSREDSLEFYRTWYAPNNAILLVAGDIDAAELKPLAERYYGVIPSREIPDRTRVKEPPQSAARDLVMTDPRVNQPTMMRSYLAPSFNSGETQYAYPLDILAEILGGTSTSRLYRALVIEQKIATSAGAFYRGSALDLATFRLYGSPVPGVTLEELETAIDAELQRLKDEPITDEEVSRATKRLVSEAVYARDSLSGAVRSFGIALTTGRTVDDVEAWPERIAAVTADQINAAADYVLNLDNSVTGQLKPVPPPEMAMDDASTNQPVRQ